VTLNNLEKRMLIYVPDFLDGGTEAPKAPLKSATVPNDSHEKLGWTITRIIQSLYYAPAEFGAALRTVLPVLFKYCYKYCYSDSRKL
jgi:hypothetical protein